MIFRTISTIAIGLALCLAAAGQTKNFTPVEGANLKAKIDSAIVSGKANAAGGGVGVGGVRLGRAGAVRAAGGGTKMRVRIEDGIALGELRRRVGVSGPKVIR